MANTSLGMTFSDEGITEWICDDKDSRLEIQSIETLKAAIRHQPLSESNAEEENAEQPEDDDNTAQENLRSR